MSVLPVQGQAWGQADSSGCARYFSACAFDASRGSSASGDPFYLLGCTLTPRDYFIRTRHLDNSTTLRGTEWRTLFTDPQAPHNAQAHVRHDVCSLATSEGVRVTVRARATPTAGDRRARMARGTSRSRVNARSSEGMALGQVQGAARGWLRATGRCARREGAARGAESECSGPERRSG